MEDLVILRDVVNTPYRVPQSKVSDFNKKTRDIAKLEYRSSDYFNALDDFFDEFKEYVDYNYTDILFDFKEPWGGRAGYIII